MIRIVTTSRLGQLVHEARAAHEQTRHIAVTASEAFGRHVRELYAVTDRAERAEAATFEVSGMLARVFEELSGAQEELLLKDIETRRLRKELNAPIVGRTLTVLSHYGEPHTIYRTREDAHADTATHGVPADAWVPAGERPAAECAWRLSAFLYDATSNGFRAAFMPAPEPIGGAA
ncbi:hypothetical protein ACFVYR_14290 [Streptomyces sp. NPDC058284]|uniref:hypothetical protein n=1 Tax=unclassified Streptomyces TaxID=2593676 RepID=UPI00366406E7